MSKDRIIETPRLLLRAARKDDVLALHEHFRDSEVMRYWSELPHRDIARTTAWVESMLSSSQNGVTDFIIDLKPDRADEKDAERPEVIGKVGVYYQRPSNEIGFLIARKHWAKGLAREALTAVLDHLFGLENTSFCLGFGLEGNEKQELSRNPSQLTVAELQSRWLYPSITADTDPRNAASIGLLHSLGFVENGYAKNTVQLGDECCDSQYWKLERQRWLDRV